MRKGQSPSPEALERMRTAQYKRRGQKLSLETIEKMKAAKCADWQRPEYRAVRSAQSQASWTRPEFRERMAEVRAAQPPPSEESRARIAASKRGKKLTDEHLIILRKRAKQLWESDAYRAKIEVRVRDPEVRARANTPESRQKKRDSKYAYWKKFTPEERSIKLANFNRAGTMASLARKASTSIEIKVQAVLEAHGIKYIPQKPLGRFFIDFFIPSQRICLECDGDYWHSRPGRSESDERKDRWLKAHKYIVIRLTETNINADANRMVCEALSITP